MNGFSLIKSIANWPNSESLAYIGGLINRAWLQLSGADFAAAVSTLLLSTHAVVFIARFQGATTPSFRLSNSSHVSCFSWENHPFAVCLRLLPISGPGGPLSGRASRKGWQNQRRLIFNWIKICVWGNYFIFSENPFLYWHRTIILFVLDS